MVGVETQDLERILQSSNPGIDVNHSMRVYELLCYLRETAEGGTIVVLGYDDSMRKHIEPMDTDIFKSHHISIYDHRINSMLSESLQHDGAVLISEQGIATNSGIYLRVDPIQVLKEQKIPNSKDLSKRFGFKLKVGTRHCCAKAVSYVMDNTFIFVLSEEYRTIRVFKKGKTIYSPEAEEIEVIIPNRVIVHDELLEEVLV